MILSISNSKLVSIVCAVLISLGLLSMTEFYFRQMIGDPYQIRDQINKENPDIIMLGNSMLGRNIDQVVFDQELSRLTGRAIHSKFIVLNGCHAAVFYVVLKDQVAASRMAGIPVGVVDSWGFIYTGNTTGDADDHLKQSLVEYDPEFFKKFDNKYFKYTFFLRGGFKTFYYSPGYSYKIFKDFYGADRLNVDPLNILRSRFGVDADPRYFNRQDKRSVSKTMNIEGSFVPDILRVSKKFRLFFVKSRFVYEKFRSNDRAASSPDRLAGYLNQRGVVLIKNQEFKELDDTSLFMDDQHLNEKGALINTRLIAKRIFEEGLLK